MSDSKHRFVKQDRIASDACSFCDSHSSCGHYFRATVELLNGYEDERGSFILVNTCGDYSWICKDCWDKIKPVLELK